LAGGKGKVLYLIAIEKKTARRAFKGHTEAVNHVDLSPDGTHALSGGDDKTIRRWDVAKETEIDKWTEHEKAIDFVRFSANGRRALTSSLDGKIHVWDVPEGRSLFFLAPQPGSPPPSSVALSPNGDRVVAGLRDGSILILAAGQKKPLGPFREHNGPVHTTAFTPDGRYLATASGDAKSATAFLWYAHGAKFRRVPFVKQAISPRALAFTADGRRAVVGSPDGTVRVWDVYGSASSSHEEMPEPSAPPPIKRGDRLVEEPSAPLVHKPPAPAPPKPGMQPRLGQKIQNSVGMKLTYIPPGKFRMGSSDREVERYQKLPNRGYDLGDSWKEEVPQHEVRLTNGFYLGVFEVTQGEYEKVMGANPSAFKESKDHPVDTVTWQDGMMFCRKLSELPEEKKAGRSYRLPTEAEWEYACRAGTTTAFHYGDSLSSKEANCNGMAPFGNAAVAKAPSLRKTVKVGSYKPNAWGLYDMHGNVWEWCLDGPRKYTPEAVDDPHGPQGDANRPLRGGSWRDGAARSAYRKARDGSKYRLNICGLRVLCEQKSR
jgi:formylglycine-generating enzyme required for sulfatase activity